MGNILDGKALAKEYRENIKGLVEKNYKIYGRVPCIATILIGDDGGSTSYVNSQMKLCKELGINGRKIMLDINTKEEDILFEINKLNEDENVDGIIVQLPLPKNINEKRITSSIDIKKDVDSLTDVNLGKFYKGEESFIPATPKGIIEIIRSTGISLEGKNAVVLGRSNIVGKPVAQLLLNENATVTICHSKTKNLKKVCSEADILISAIGKPESISEDYVKKGAIVIDVGTTKIEGKIKGDVCFEEALKKASYVTPVPGGVGSMTTTMLIKNTCEAFERNVYKNIDSY